MEYTNRLSALLLSALFGAVTAVLSLIRIPLPFTPVPITGQSLGPMLSGLVLGPRYGAISQMVYVAMGALGLPVFAGGAAGPGVLFGPSGGYVWGFVVGAWVTGALFQRHKSARTGNGKRFGAALGSALVGGVLGVYLLGVVQLSLVAGISIGKAILLGALPFVPGDLLKSLVAATSGPRIASLSERVLKNARRERPEHYVNDE